MKSSACTHLLNKKLSFKKKSHFLNGNLSIQTETSIFKRKPHFLN